MEFGVYFAWLDRPGVVALVGKLCYLDVRVLETWHIGNKDVGVCKLLHIHSRICHANSTVLPLSALVIKI